MTPNHRAGHERAAGAFIALFFFTWTTCLPVNAGEPPVNVTKVAIVGDSIMRALSHAMERELIKQPGFSVYTFTSLRAGLSRLDLFDWLAKIEGIMKSKKPAIVVIMMGVNDRQAIRIPSEATTSAGEKDWDQDEADSDTQSFNVIPPDDPGWSQEYARRVGAAMDVILASGVKRIFWIELPDMREPKLQEDSILINTLIQKEAAARSNVVFEPSKKLLSRTPGVFTPYIYSTNGMPLQVRDTEGVNLDRNGAELLARKVISHILETQNNTAP